MLKLVLSGLISGLFPCVLGLAVAHTQVVLGADPGCLVCHGAVQDAPKTMVDLYGDANGFGWKLNEVVGSQVVSVPMSIPLDRAMGAFETFMLLTGLVFVALAIVLNLLLHRIVIRPVMRMSTIAEDIRAWAISMRRNSERRVLTRSALWRNRSIACDAASSMR